MENFLWPRLIIAWGFQCAAKLPRTEAGDRDGNPVSVTAGGWSALEAALSPSGHTAKNILLYLHEYMG